MVNKYLGLKPCKGAKKKSKTCTCLPLFSFTEPSPPQASLEHKRQYLKLNAHYLREVVIKCLNCNSNGK